MPFAPLAELGRLSETGALAVALVLGFAFGWFLERAGLGSPRRIVAQFELTDLAVLKVMFSAIVTAMLGLFWLGRLGVVDVSLVYVPETFLGAQLAGGVIFGAGFVIGGTCPGTSCVAAATGRVDGLAVIAGMLGGIAVFGAAFDTLAPLYESGARGTLTLSGLLGIETGTAVLAMTAVALLAFVVAERVERSRSVHG